MGTLLETAIVNGIRNMAMIESYHEKEELRRDAKSHTLTDWRIKSIAKVAGVGGLTGLTGGWWGVALEAGDIAYLMSVSGRACYGIGHILNRDIDYDCDITNILAVWCGAAEAANYVALGKIGMKIASKNSAKLGIKAGAKIVTKVALKGSSKATQKIVTKVASKLAAKIATKVGTKWIPIIGGVVSAGINSWVASGLLDASEDYYKHNYLQFNDEISRNLY